MAKAYVVHYESGEYSNWLLAVEGVFSTREKAVAYIESLTFPVVWDDGMTYCRTKDCFINSYDSSGVAKPIANVDGTWTPMCGDKVAYFYLGYERTYYVTEYEMDEPCRDM